MHGINGNVAVHLSQRLAIVGDVGVYRATTILSTKHYLTLATYMFGPRVYLKRNRTIGESTRTFNPWGQFLIGGAHADGTLAGTASRSSNGLSFSVGGGVDLNIQRYMAWRIAQPEFIHTTIPNGVNDRQNNFRLMTGIVFRLGQQH